jgi:hypothetical protein
MADRASEFMVDLCDDRGSGYDFDRDDRESAVKLSKLRRGLLVTGDEQTDVEAEALLKEVIRVELDNWVPDASQRLIDRASLVLTGEKLLDPIIAPDHGDSPAVHSLVQDWVCGIFVLRCATCAHMYKV